MIKNKVCVYTALFGDYDTLVDPPENLVDCAFICFTDQLHLKSDIWEIRYVENLNLSPSMMNRRYKILPHLYLKDYDISLYIDTNLVVNIKPHVFANFALGNKNIALPKHAWRNCIYEEAIECLVFDKVKFSGIKAQLERYHSAGFPNNYGLGENNILIRRHNEREVILLMDDWWKELCNFTQRDQLSLFYLLWKTQFDYKLLAEGARVEGGPFKYNSHKSVIKNYTLFAAIKPFVDSLRYRIKRFFYKSLFYRFFS